MLLAVVGVVVFVGQGVRGAWPLSPAALKVLKELPRMEGTDLVFPPTRGNKPLSDNTLTKVLKDMGYQEVYNLGAFKDWVESGGEVEKI